LRGRTCQGGDSRMSRKAHWIGHSSSSLGAAEIRAGQKVIKNNHVGYGPQAAALETRIAKATRRKHAFAVTSGFHALALALGALDLPRSSLVALPVLTCPSILAAIQRCGHKPYLADIQEQDLTVAPATISRQAEAVVAPHAYGAPVDAKALGQLRLPWIEDCATSPTARAAGRVAGASGTIAIFSFGSTKYLTGGTGGILLTDDDSIAYRVQDLLEFDRFDKRGEWRHGFPGAWPGRMADLNASVALVQWNRLPTFHARRHEIARVYERGLRDVSGLCLPRIRPGHGLYRYIIGTSKPALAFAQELRSSGIDARTSVNPFLDGAAPDLPGGPWPVAEKWRDHLLSLPVYPNLSRSQARYIVEKMIETTKSLEET
jgi:dTDP-4-amino-4,6-dideoxygalactose transaminase